jgi:hypothetical protein
MSKVFNLIDLDDPVLITNAETSIDWIKDYIRPDDILLSQSRICFIQSLLTMTALAILVQKW